MPLLLFLCHCKHLIVNIFVGNLASWESFLYCIEATRLQDNIKPHLEPPG